jgi:hypothetical protein
VKRFYLRQIAKGKSPQDAQVAAARKLACIVWKILTSKERYVEEDRYLTSRKMSRLSQIAKRPLEHKTKPEDVSTLVGDLKSGTDVLEKYPEEMDRIPGHRRRRGRSNSSRRRTPEAGGVVAK